MRQLDDMVACAGDFAPAATLAAPLQADDDLLIADFEGPDYGDWKTTGEAFGPGPARGTLPHQMPVSGFEGEGLVNTFFNGDATTGRLLSPEFRLSRKFINFLIGGGQHPGETGMQLLVDGKPVCTITGIDSEHLEWASWDIADLAGKDVRLEIFDRHTGGWGHINVDQIGQSNTRRGEVPEQVALYRERLRPQFHFTSARNWLNDPNGLVYHEGEYHLFFQHNPSGINWGNMTWGHAVSPDLFHWKQLDNALLPDQLGTMFSGSAVVDWQNTPGLGNGKAPPLVAIYTAAGGTSPESQGKPFTQAIASSNDRGRTWQKFDQNPVLPHQAGENRDPKVFWHAPSKQWVMALYLEGDRYGLFGSPDLKQWKKLSDVPPFGDGECPDMFELAVAGQADVRKWIFWGGGNNYLIGTFDGTTFTKESGPHRFEFGPNYYAAQTYSDIPASDGRRIQIGWMRGGSYPRMPFNQQMAVPSELFLEAAPAGPRLCRRPVRELDGLRGEKRSWSGSLQDSDNPLADLAGDLFDIVAEIELGQAKQIVFTLRGTNVDYDVAARKLRIAGSEAPLDPVDGRIQLRLLVDRSSIEVFGNDGLATLSACFVPPADNLRLRLAGPGATVRSLEVWKLHSTWDDAR